MSGARPYATARQGLRTRLADRASLRARSRRLRLFERLLDPRAGETAVDVGCGTAGLATLGTPLAVTGVDRVPRAEYPGERFVQADATDLPFSDGEFDIAYSNSVVEHLPPADRPAFAAELRRAGGRWLVQTPNRAFPIEPHSLLPFVHWLPRGLGRRLWRLGVSGDPYDEVRLLGIRELRALLPDAVIVRERFGPLTKSFVAVGPRERVSRAPARG
ncbi:MAG TPA: class I SAM-dependent methyltransferase [Thermoleophilaceae bacterium]|nr:class I SAM-dependent methyltransferase [Thermoleophilaceae bacterium]